MANQLGHGDQSRDQGVIVSVAGVALEPTFTVTIA